MPSLGEPPAPEKVDRSTPLVREIATQGIQKALANMEATEQTPDLVEGAFRRASDAAVIQALASDDIEAIARVAIHEYLGTIEESAGAVDLAAMHLRPQPPEFLKLQAKPLSELTAEEAFRRGFHNGQANLLQMLWGAASYGPTLAADAALLASLFSSAHSFCAEPRSSADIEELRGVDLILRFPETLALEATRPLDGAPRPPLVTLGSD